MSRSVAQKMGIKEGVRAFFVNAPALALETIELPELEVSRNLDGDFKATSTSSASPSSNENTFRSSSFV